MTAAADLIRRSALSSKYRSATFAENNPEAAASSRLSVNSGTTVIIAAAPHGRCLPVPPPASSTGRYLASCRRWNEQLAGFRPAARRPGWRSAGLCLFLDGLVEFPEAGLGAGESLAGEGHEKAAEGLALH
jgi:hypothetical protein